MSNPYLEANRLRKVLALARVLRIGNITSELASRMAAEDWRAVAASAQIKPPSRDTQLATIEELRKSEAISQRVANGVRSEPEALPEWPEESSFGPTESMEGDMSRRRRR